MSFGPLLRLGMAGLSEVVDIRLQEDVPAEVVLEKLTKQCPDGIVIRSLHALGPDAWKPPSSAHGRLSHLCAESGRRTDSTKVLQKLLDRKEIPIDRLTKKGKPKVVDIRPGIRNLSWLAEVPSDVQGLQTCRPKKVCCRCESAFRGITLRSLKTSSFSCSTVSCPRECRWCAGGFSRHPVPKLCKGSDSGKDQTLTGFFRK